MKYFIIVFIGILLISCDPLRRIDMKNTGSEDAEFIWSLKEMDSLYKSPFFLSNSKKIKFKLNANKPYNEANMSFGSGIWTRQAIDSITERLDSLEIKSSAGTIKMGAEDINSLLKNHRKGLGKRTIVLTTSDLTSGMH